MKASEMVVAMERENESLRAENLRLKNLIHDHGLREGLIPRIVLNATKVVSVPGVEQGTFND